MVGGKTKQDVEPFGQYIESRNGVTVTFQVWYI